MKETYIISFSPTESSLKIAKYILKEMKINQYHIIDLCKNIDHKIQLDADDLCIFTMPCYGGRIPQIAKTRLEHIYGSCTPCIICVTFGNRAFEDALLELSDSVNSLGFKTIAGCAIATEHNIMHVYGTGRPDQQDYNEITMFANSIKQKLQKGSNGYLHFPGNNPYKSWSGSHAKIYVNEDTCTHCGLCASKCPVQAISKDGQHLDEQLCINCMRCIQVCPKHSRYISQEYLSALITKLSLACQDRKKNEFYL